MCTEPPKKYDFVKESSKRGPIRWTGLVVTVIVGGAAVYYVKQAKEEMEKSMLFYEIFWDFLNAQLNKQYELEFYGL